MSQNLGGSAAIRRGRRRTFTKRKHPGNGEDMSLPDDRVVFAIVVSSER
jgi:hypothetical protein